MKINNIGTMSKQSLFKNNANKDQLREGVVNNGLFGQARLGQGKENKTSSLVKSLYEQKNNLLENKRQLMADAAEEGGGGISAGLKTQLADIEDQLKLLDEQISQQLLDEQKEALGLDKSKEKDKYEKSVQSPLTLEEAEAEKVKDIISVTGSMAQVKTISAVRKDMKSTIKVLEMEASLDESRSISGQRSPKRDTILKLNSRIAKMDESIAKTLDEVLEKNGDAPLVESAPEESTNPLPTEANEQDSPEKDFVQ